MIRKTDMADLLCEQASVPGGWCVLQCCFLFLFIISLYSFHPEAPYDEIAARLSARAVALCHFFLFFSFLSLSLSVSFALLLSVICRGVLTHCRL